MATADTVLTKILAAVDEAYLLASKPNPGAEVVTLKAQVVTLQSKLTSALVLVDQAIATDTVSDQQEAARFTALRNAIQ